MILLRKTPILAIALLAVVAIGCNNSEENVPVKETVEINMDNLTVVDYAVEGMVCAMGCAATIQEEVGGMNGVAVANVNYDAETAHFEYDAAIVSEEELVAKIESIADGQYTVKTIEVTVTDEEEVKEEVENTNSEKE